MSELTAPLKLAEAVNEHDQQEYGFAFLPRPVHSPCDPWLSTPTCHAVGLSLALGLLCSQGQKERKGDVGADA